MNGKAGKLLARAALRWEVARLGARFYTCLLWLAGAYAILLVSSRLLALLPVVFTPLHLPALAAAALAVAAVTHRRPPIPAAARLVDRSLETEDLFLTAAMIDTASGGYQALVLRDAERAAESVRAASVVPFQPWPRLRNTAVVLAGLLVAGLFLPQLDPFGREQQRQRKAEQLKQLQDSRKATELRLAMLDGAGAEAELSQAVQNALESLKKTFASMKPTEKQGNLERLQAHQSDLGQMWRRAAERKLNNAAPPAFDPQRFGQEAESKSSQWQRELQKGDARGLKEELESLKEAVDRLAGMPEGMEKQKLEQEIQQSLQQMSEFAGSNLNCPELSAALSRALEQLSMSGMEGLSSEALAGLSESLDLSELELESLAQSLRDLQGLEEALKALQLARMLNDLDPLDGEACDQCQGMADYEALYAELMKACQGGGALAGSGAGPGIGVMGNLPGNGVGPGMGGPGIGTGGTAPEDPTLETSYKSERSQSALTAGKILLSLKTQGLSDPGEANVSYADYVEQVKQGVSEAILHEQVPPAYHEGVRRYFDSMEAGDAEPSEE